MASKSKGSKKSTHKKTRARKKSVVNRLAAVWGWPKKSTHKKAKKAKTVAAGKTVSRRAHMPKVAAHGKTTAERQQYIKYLAAKKKLIKDIWG